MRNLIKTILLLPLMSFFCANLVANDQRKNPEIVYELNSEDKKANNDFYQKWIDNFMYDEGYYLLEERSRKIQDYVKHDKLIAEEWGDIRSERCAVILLPLCSTSMNFASGVRIKKQVYVLRVYHVPWMKDSWCASKGFFVVVKVTQLKDLREKKDACEMLKMQLLSVDEKVDLDEIPPVENLQKDMAQQVELFLQHCDAKEKKQQTEASSNKEK